MDHDWSERVATAVANRLGVPASRVELATRDGVRGVVSKTFAPHDSGLHPHDSGLQLSNANVLLPNFVDGYDAHKKGAVPGYTLDAAFAVLAEYGPPPGTPDGVGEGASPAT